MRKADRQAEFITDSYATVGVAYQRAAGLYSADIFDLLLNISAKQRRVRRYANLKLLFENAN